MVWQQLSFLIAAADAERCADWLGEHGAVSVTFVDAADRPVFEPAPGTTPLWADTRLVALYEADAGHDLSVLAVALCHALDIETLPNLTIEALEDRDWVRAWMDDFHPMCFGTRLWVCPHGQPPADPAAEVVWLDPGLAFGTGTHATTALCLRWLDAADLTGKSVMDFGCGSGILAMAAARLGAQSVAVIDTDPQALLATRQNAAANGLAARMIELAPDAMPSAPVDILLANILAGPLIALAPHFARLLRPQGDVVLSGILAEQAEEVAAAYQSDFLMDPPLVVDGWVRLQGKRRTG